MRNCSELARSSLRSLRDGCYLIVTAGTVFVVLGDLQRRV